MFIGAGFLGLVLVFLILFLFYILLFNGGPLMNIQMFHLISGCTFILYFTPIIIYNYIKSRSKKKTIYPGSYRFTNEGIFIRVRPFEKKLIKYEDMKDVRKGRFDIVSIEEGENIFKIRMTEGQARKIFEKMH
ncbi:MAG: hypothetical protein ACMUHM_01310 [Thermoplasmatota archaeon]